MEGQYGPAGLGCRKPGGMNSCYTATAAAANQQEAQPTPNHTTHHHPNTHTPAATRDDDWVTHRGNKRDQSDGQFNQGNNQPTNQQCNAKHTEQHQGQAAPHYPLQLWQQQQQIGQVQPLQQPLAHTSAITTSQQVGGWGLRV